MTRYRMEQNGTDETTAATELTATQCVAVPYIVAASALDKRASLASIGRTTPLPVYGTPTINCD
jgi:hypothetical protein